MVNENEQDAQKVAATENPAVTLMATPRATENPEKPIDHQLIHQLRESASGDHTWLVAQNAVTRSGIDESATSRKKSLISRTMSHRLDTWKVTSQKKSGRCWLFSSLNLLRSRARSVLNVKDFEFSQNYALFWDKFERANFFLENIRATAGESLDSRIVQFLLSDVLSDGGQWDMAASIYLKYGAVPKEAMPESTVSSCTARMNSQLQALLRRAALRIRDCVNGGEPVHAVEALKREVLADVWRILTICLGEPPEVFDWQWQDDNGVFHREGEMTPHEFLKRYVDIDVRDYVCLVDDPRREHPRAHAETVDYLGNVVGGQEIRYINTDIDTIKTLAMHTIMDGEPVWFGADVSFQTDREGGLLVEGLFDYSGLFGVDLHSTKEERVNTGDSAMNHAMLFVGVDAPEGTPRRWRVENSWGENPGDHGYFTMDDAWFSEYVFEVVVRKDRLPENLQAALKEDPMHLPAWDPMGTLA